MTTTRMTCMGRLGTLQLLQCDTSEERNSLLNELQEQDRLQYLQDEMDDYSNETGE